MMDVCICTYGNLRSPERDLVRCVYAIKNSGTPIHKIIVLAKYISPELRIFAKNEKLILKKQKKEKKLGFHRAQCLYFAQTKWVLFVDDDVYLPSNWYLKIKNEMQKDLNIFAVQGVKIYEQEFFFDYFNSANNFVLFVKYIRNKIEKGTHICSFENTLVNRKMVLHHGGDKVLQNFDSGEDWALLEHMRKYNKKWESKLDLVVTHNKLSSRSFKERINWYSKKNKGSNLFTRFLISIIDIINLVLIFIVVEIYLIILFLYTVFIYVRNRFGLLINILK